jgi:hypothetical protein
MVIVEFDFVEARIPTLHHGAELAAHQPLLGQ